MGSLVTGDQYRADDDVYIAQLLPDVVLRRVECRHISRQLDAQLTQTGQRNVRDHHISTHTCCHASGCLTDSTTAEDEHLRRFHAGHTTDELPLSAFCLLKIIGTIENSHASGHLTHRAQQRQTVVYFLHRLVGQTHCTALDHSLSQRPVTGKMEIGVDQLVFANQRILRFDRFLDLDNHIRLGILDRRQYLGTYVLVCLISETTTLSGRMLYEDLVPMLNQLGDTGGSYAYTTLTLLDLFGNSNFVTSLAKIRDLGIGCTFVHPLFYLFNQ